MSKSTQTIGLYIFFGLITVFGGIAFFWWTVLPYVQMSDYVSKENDMRQGIENTDNDSFIFDTHTFATAEIHYQFLDFLLSLTAGNPKPSDIFDNAIASSKAYIDKFPSPYYRYYVKLATAYDVNAVLHNDSSLYATADMYYQKALQIVPNRQDVIYGYSVDLIRQGRDQDAIAILRNALLQDSANYETNYYLAFALAFAPNHDSYNNEILSRFEYAIDNDVAGIDYASLQKIYENLFAYYYQTKNVADFTTVVKRLAVWDPQQSAIFDKILDYIQKNNSIPLLNIQN